MQNLNKTNNIRILVILGFAILYSTISMVNHYMFRTYALDLGIYNQAMYDYAHFRINHNTVFQPDFGNLLSDHFELLLIIVSPLYYLFGSYTLLIVQIVALLLGGQGIYKYVELISNSRKLAIAAMIQFFLFYGIYSALTFDYHNNVVGTMLVPWIFYFIHKNKWKQSVFLFVLFLVSKENMALWGFFIFAGIMIMYRKDRKKLIFSAILCVVSLAYFLFVVKWLIPFLGKPGNGYMHFRYSVLGNNINEALTTIITRPLYAFKLLFINPLGTVEGDYVKTELHLAILLSGGILLFFRPYYLIMLLPIYGQKLFCDYVTYWGLGCHYSIEFAPIITIGAFTFINNIQKQRTRRNITYLLILFTAYVTLRTFRDDTYTYFTRENQRFYLKEHYTRAFDIKKAYSILKLIPENVPVSAQDEFVPRLAFREKIYTFPNVVDAEYILLLLEGGSYYPLFKEQYEQKVYEYLKNNTWSVFYNDYPFLILKKKSTDELANTNTTVSEETVTYFCNADSVAQDKVFFFSNNNKQVFYNVNTQSNEKAFSGKYSVKLTRDNPYGLSTTLLNVKKGSFFKITAWMYSGDKNCCIVASGKSSDSFYLSDNKNTGKELNGWKQIKLEFLITRDLPDDILNIYLLNGGKKTVYFDDLTITIFFTNTDKRYLKVPQSKL